MREMTEENTFRRVTPTSKKLSGVRKHVVHRRAGIGATSGLPPATLRSRSSGTIPQTAETMVFKRQVRAQLRFSTNVRKGHFLNRYSRIQKVYFSQSCPRKAPRGCAPDKNGCKSRKKMICWFPHGEQEGMSQDGIRDQCDDE